MRSHSFQGIPETSQNAQKCYPCARYEASPISREAHHEVPDDLYETLSSAAVDAVHMQGLSILFMIVLNLSQGLDFTQFAAVDPWPHDLDVH